MRWCRGPRDAGVVFGEGRQVVVMMMMRDEVMRI